MKLLYVPTLAVIAYYLLSEQYIAAVVVTLVTVAFYVKK